MDYYQIMIYHQDNELNSVVIKFNQGGYPSWISTG
jgi:hypothetical protein